MRLFIAITPPEHIQQFLLSLQKKVQDLGTLSFTQDAHLTLKFLGEVSPTQLKKIQEKLNTLTFKPFTLTLDTLGVFPPQNNPCILWAGVQPHKPVLTLQTKINTLLTPQFSPDKHFHPHFTIARIKKVKDKKLFLKHIKQLIVEKKTFLVHSFELIQSTLLPRKKPVYTILERYPH